MTPRPRTVISARPRLEDGDTSMRFLGEPTYNLDRQPFITQRMRSVLVSWLVEVAVEYNCSMSAYHLAISLLDEMLSRGPSRSELFKWERENADFDLEDVDFDNEGYLEVPEHWFVVNRGGCLAVECSHLTNIRSCSNVTAPACGLPQSLRIEILHSLVISFTFPTNPLHKRSSCRWNAVSAKPFNSI